MFDFPETALARRLSRFGAVALVAVGVSVVPLVRPEGSRGSVSAAECDLIAGPDGSDRETGSSGQPIDGPEMLVKTLEAGQVGCLRAGDYTTDGEVSIRTPGITLTSYPGERATVHGRLWIERTGDGVTVSNLDLDGRNPTDLPSPTINADDVTLRRNNITNHHTAICVSIGSPDTYGRAHRTLIEGNHIHDCGRLPPTNQNHGIYVNSSDDAVIRNNRIFDNADRGIQLYPDAQRTLVTGNVIDGNGVGVIFGGSETTTSSDNVIESNVITNSRVRGNVDYSWGGERGTGNVIADNCTGGSFRERAAGVLGNSALLGLADAPAVVGYTATSFGTPEMELAGTCARVLLVERSKDR